MRPGETLLAYLRRCGRARGTRPGGNTVLMSRISRWRVNPTKAEALAIAAEAAESDDPAVQALAAELKELL